MFKDLKQLKDLGPVTHFRLLNAFFIQILVAAMISPLIVLKGQFMLPWVISIFVIASTLAVKTNRFMTTRFNIGQIYKMGVIMQITLALVIFVYFYSPILSTYLISLMSIAEITIFSAFSIMLNNYITMVHPEQMNHFQIVRNSIIADANIVGLIIATILLLFDISYIMLFIAVVHLIFSFWLLYNWNFFTKHQVNI